MYGNAYLLLTLMALFFGGNAVAGRLAVGEISPFQMVTLRWAIVLLLLWIWQGRRIMAAREQARPRARWIFIMGASGFTAFNLLFYLAAHHTSAANLGIIQGTIPVWVLLGVFLLHRARAKAAQWVGVLITLGGVLLLAARGDWETLATFAVNSGDALMFIACLIYACYTVGLKSRPPIRGVIFFAYLAAAAFVSSLPFMIGEIALGRAFWPTANGWLILLYVAIFPSFLSHIFYIRGVELLGPGRAGVFINLVPVFAPLLAVMLLGEAILWFQGTALLMVFLGIWLSEHSGRKWAE